MPEAKDLFDLPIQVQLTLAGGYAAYVLSYVGIRTFHSPIETTFLTLVYGLISTGVYALLHQDAHWAAALALPIAFVSSCLVGVLWRVKGRALYMKAVTKSHLSSSDDDPSAWASLLSDEDHYLCQISVLLDDGTWLECDDTRDYAKAPFGPCRFGPSGDIIMYVTQVEAPGKSPKTQESIKDSFWGDLLTFVPASKVRYVTMRHKLKSDDVKSASAGLP